MAHVTPSTHPWWIPLLVSAAVSGLGWVYASYSSDAKELAKVRQQVEDHQKIDDATNQRLDRIESKLDDLIKWAYGSHPH